MINSFNLYWDDVLSQWSNDFRMTYGYDDNNNYIEKESNQWDSTQNDYILSDYDNKTENIYEEEKGNYIEINKCLNPLRYYSGSSIRYLYPYPEPSKSFSKITEDNSVQGIIRNFIDKKIEESKEGVSQ